MRSTPALAATVLALVTVAACSGGEGDVVTIFGPEVDSEQESLQEAFEGFTDETGIEVEVLGSGDFVAQIGPQVQTGDPPDIAMFPQPGLLLDHAEDLQELSEDVAEEVEEDFDPGFTDLVRRDGQLVAVPAKADLKSLVWYSPAAFAEAGYDLPDTFDDFLALADEMVEDGNTPLCAGIESGDASGWPMTDWIEDFVLRMSGPDTYDRWYRHEIPFDDREVVEAAEQVAELWTEPAYVFGGPDAAAATSFGDAGLPLLDGECMMHRQANFYAAQWPDGTELGDDGDVSAFYLPGSDEHPNITLTGGLYAAAFADDEDTQEVMAFIASTDFADARASDGGYLSPNQNVDASLYPDELTRNFGEVLAGADPVRYDASDLMPSAVGTGSFLQATIDITTGTAEVATALGDVEATWPEPET